MSRVSLAIGQFDGVHRGHRAVLAAARAALGPGGGEVRVLTFSPHPAAVLHPGGAPPLLASDDDKARLLRAAGADAVDVWPFDAALAATSPGDFWERLAAAYPSLAAVATGDSFTFGAGAAAGIRELAALAAAAGVRAAVAPRAEWRGAAVSSSRVRDALRDGDPAAAAAMLGRPFAVAGPVVRGRAQGRTRGLPTANVPLPPGLARPAPGVYAGRLCAGDSSWPAGVFVPDPGDPRQALFGGVLEAHAVGADTGDLYGRPARVLFGPRLRGFRPYPSPADEAAGIRADLREVLRECERFDWSEHEN